MNCGSRHLKQYIPYLEAKSLSASRFGTIKFAVCTRFFFLFAMMLSSALIPTFDAGGDVLTFDLRLDASSDKSVAGCWDHFCSQGHACEILLKTSKSRLTGNPIEVGQVKGPPLKCWNEERYEWGEIKVSLYKLILKPFTQWDAARFLNLAVNLTARYPKQIHVDDDFNICENDLINDMESSTHSNFDSTCRRNDLFASSEQSHAFFPLFPLIIRYLALILCQITPMVIMPPSFEAVVVLSSLLWNIMSFVIAALALHQLTYTLVMDKGTRGSGTGYEENNTDETSVYALELANTTSALFCLNPASVFFSTCYSETTFSALTFLGYSFWANGLYANILWKRTIFVFISTIFWMLASYTRSNGGLAAIFVVINVCAMIAKYNGEHKGTIFRGILGTFFKGSQLAIYHAIPVACIIAPIMFHDRRGKQMHCSSPDTVMKPQWCEYVNGEDIESFSLYAYVQKEHWNVGFLRYYELKQIPNFLLAIPILIISISAVTSWIKRSWNLYTNDYRVRCQLLNVWKWAIFSLTWMLPKDSSLMQNQNINRPSDTLLASNMLGHYCLLAGFTAVGLTLAHVQISTRLICSACPAIYWYMSALVLRDSSKGLGLYLLIYLAIFNILGVILHVNALPWT